MSEALFPATTARVARQTDEDVNERIRRDTAARITYFASHPDEIDRRLDELDAEWDIERTLQANAATLALAGTVLGMAADRRWLVLPAMVSGFLLQHALQGWCPPLPVFRRLGVRTATEIEAERYALKILRGDFATAAGVDGRSPDQRAEEALRAVRSEVGSGG